jgi:hypothetical protein
VTICRGLIAKVSYRPAEGRSTGAERWKKMIRLHAEDIGFKEWSLVCDAMGSGRQSIILRKGGIAEGRGGFQWQAQKFWLFPTHFHEQAQKVIWPAPPAGPGLAAKVDQVTIELYARIERATEVTTWATAAALAPMHVWREEVIRERFGYGPAVGLSLAFVRIFRLPTPWTFPSKPAFGGCRSWVDLPEHGTSNLQPVLPDADHEARRRQLDEILGE